MEIRPSHRFLPEELKQGIDTGLDTPFDFPVYYAIRDVLLHDKPMTKLPEVMAAGPAVSTS